MEAHPEMELYVGMDIDPTALEIGRGHIEAFLASRESNGGELCAYTVGNKPSAIVFAAGGCVCARGCELGSGRVCAPGRAERDRVRRWSWREWSQDRGVIELVRASRREAVGVVRAPALTAVSPEHVERVGVHRGGAEEVVAAR